MATVNPAMAAIALQQGYDAHHNARMLGILDDARDYQDQLISIGGALNALYQNQNTTGEAVDLSAFYPQLQEAQAKFEKMEGVVPELEACASVSQADLQQMINQFEMAKMEVEQELPKTNRSMRELGENMTEIVEIMKKMLEDWAELIRRIQHLTGRG